PFLYSDAGQLDGNVFCDLTAERDFHAANLYVAYREGMPTGSFPSWNFENRSQPLPGRPARNLEICRGDWCAIGFIETGQVDLVDVQSNRVLDGNGVALTGETIDDITNVRITGTIRHAELSAANQFVGIRDGRTVRMFALHCGERCNVDLGPERVVRLD